MDTPSAIELTAVESVMEGYGTLEGYGTMEGYGTFVDSIVASLMACLKEDDRATTVDDTVLECCLKEDGKKLVLMHALGRQVVQGKKYVVGEFYTVDIETGIVVNLQSPPLLDDDSLTRVILLGSTLYVLGGYHRDQQPGCHFRVSRFNFSPENENRTSWEHLPPFESPDIQGNCVAYKGKIYMFRGMGLHRQDSRFTNIGGEVFNIALQTWETITPPYPVVHPTALLMRTSVPCVMDSKNKRILVHFPDMNALYAFHPDRRFECWEPVVSTDFFTWNSNVILFDDVLYFFVSPLFVAFDLQTKTWLSVTTLTPSKFDAELLEFEFESFFHVRDNTVCLATWSTDDDPNKTRLVFVKFLIERSTSSKEIIVTPLGCDTFYTNCSCSVTSFVPL